MSQGSRKDSKPKKAASFEETKHFVWTISAPSTMHAEFPESIYNPFSVEVGGSVVVIANDFFDWPEARVLYYNVKQHSWRIVSKEGPTLSMRYFIVGHANDLLYLLDAEEPVAVHSFDLLLHEWRPLGIEGMMNKTRTRARCFVEDIKSFISWDAEQDNSLLTLYVESLKWSKRVTKGQSPTALHSRPRTCSYGRVVYVAFDEHDGKTSLYTLTMCQNRFYWSRPRIDGLRPDTAGEGTLTYSAGRLFQFGGFNRGPTAALYVYDIKEEMWRNVQYNSASEYSVEGEKIGAANHCTVALPEKLIVFGGLSLRFKQCRMLEARQFE